VRARRNEAACEVTVSDNGPGLEPDEQMRIFRRFYKSDAARDARRSGFGLGLSICRKIVEVHGGLIKAEGRRGEGTTIRVHLPA
jgi:signal transduction histidine kinase